MKYKVTFPKHDYECEVEAESHELAAEKASEEAFINWAFDLPVSAYPMEVVVETDRSIFKTKVDLEFDPVFFVIESKRTSKLKEEAEDEEEAIPWI